MTPSGGPRERPEATSGADGAQRSEAKSAARGAEGAASAAPELPAPPATPAAIRRDEVTVRLIRRDGENRPQPYWEARAYFHGAEAIRTVGTSRHAAFGGAVAALTAHWLRDGS